MLLHISEVVAVASHATSDRASSLLAQKTHRKKNRIYIFIPEEKYNNEKIYLFSFSHAFIASCKRHIASVTLLHHKYVRLPQHSPGIASATQHSCLHGDIKDREVKGSGTERGREEEGERKDGEQRQSQTEIVKMDCAT